MPKVQRAGLNLQALGAKLQAMKVRLAARSGKSRRR
jgi:hypothetical protein